MQYTVIGWNQLMALTAQSTQTVALSQGLLPLSESGVPTIYGCPSQAII